MAPRDKTERPKRPGRPQAARGGKPPRKDNDSRPPRDRKPRSDAPRDAKPPRAAAPASVTDAAQTPERISKLLARAGVASRRDCERMIMAGRVAVNGKVLDSPAFNATLADRIEVDGVPIRGIERTRLWLYHKPAGLVTTNSDPEGRPTVFEKLPGELPRVLSIGRLDINTEGLLLLTNDGGLARVLELPSTGWLRRYRVRAHGKTDQAELDKLKDGIAVEGVLYGSIEATLDRTQGANVWLTVGLREGKNREIKKVLGALGLDVGRLIRISYGPFQLGDLAEGNVREVRGRLLRDQLGPRLIEEAGADFEAPLHEPEKPAAKAAEPEWKPRESKDGDGKPDRDRSGGGEKPFRRSRDERRDDRREEGLSRLDTKPGGRDDGKFAGKPKRPPPRSRASNVWMAPGARPLGPTKAKAAAEKADARARSDAKSGAKSGPKRDRSDKSGPSGAKGKPDRGGGGKPASGRGRPGGGRPDGAKPGGPKGSSRGSGSGRPSPKGPGSADRRR